MKWLRITAVFVLMTLVKSGPTRNEAPVPESTKISRIDRVLTGNFKFTFNPILAADPTKYMLEVFSEGEMENPVTANPTGKLDSVTFETDLETYSGSEAYFLITGLNDKSELIGFAEAKLKTFPNFPSGLTPILIKNDGLPDGQLLRVDGNMGDMTIKDGICVSKEKTQYCSGVTDCAPCDNTNSIPVCDAPIPADQATATKGDLNSAILSYKDDSTATIKLSFDVDPTPIPIRDVIINLSDIDKNLLFTDGEECTITGKFPGTDTQNLIILQKADPDVWTTNSVDIIDRELHITILGDDIIEGRWNILNAEKTPGGTPTYRLSIAKDAGPVDPTEDIDVDCSNLEQTYCFGYFPITEPGDYRLIVAHQTDELRQVESKPQTKSSSSEPELAILSRRTTRHANQLMADVNICFEHLTPTEGRSFSHYEMLIINEKGQWLKHRILEEEKEREGRLCFTPFPINTKDFDLTEGTKVIVSQRGVDGFTVLATGQSKLL